MNSQRETKHLMDAIEVQVAALSSIEEIEAQRRRSALEFVEFVSAGGASLLKGKKRHSAFDSTAWHLSTINLYLELRQQELERKS